MLIKTFRIGDFILYMKLGFIESIHVCFIDYMGFFSFQNKQEFCKIDLRKAVNISKILMIIMKIYMYFYTVHAVSI